MNKNHKKKTKIKEEKVEKEKSKRIITKNMLFPFYFPLIIKDKQTLFVIFFTLFYLVNYSVDPIF